MKDRREIPKNTKTPEKKSRRGGLLWLRVNLPLNPNRVEDREDHGALCQFYSKRLELRRQMAEWSFVFFSLQHLRSRVPAPQPSPRAPDIVDAHRLVVRPQNSGVLQTPHPTACPQAGIPTHYGLDIDRAYSLTFNVKPLFKLFNLNESRISLNSCWVEVLKNREHQTPRKSGVKGGACNTHLNVKL